MRQGRSQFETSSYYCTLASAITLIAHYPTLHSILHFFSDARVGGRNRCNSKSCPVGKLAASFAAKCGGVIVIVTSRHGYRLRNQYNLTGSHLGRGRGRTLSTLRSTANLLLWYQFFRKFLPPPSAKISARYHVPGDRLSVPRILILILQSFPPADAIHNGLGILLTAFKSVVSDLKCAIELLESMESFLNRLDIYTKVPPTPAMTEIIVKIMVELLSTLALATNQIRQGRPKKFVKKLFGENGVNAVLQRLDRLTQDEARTTAAKTLEVVYGLFQNMRVVIDGVD
ncbi:hypothetical protein V8E52_007480 [Russula decolorans]